MAHRILIADDNDLPYPNVGIGFLFCWALNDAPALRSWSTFGQQIFQGLEHS